MILNIFIYQRWYQLTVYFLSADLKKIVLSLLIGFILIIYILSFQVKTGPIKCRGTLKYCENRNNFSLKNLYNSVQMLIVSNLIYIHFHFSIGYNFFMTITLIITLHIFEVECFEVHGPNRTSCFLKKYFFFYLNRDLCKKVVQKRAFFF